MNVLIVDDEPLAAEILETYLKKIPDANLVATCSNALQAFALLNKHPVDVLLLDINMPEMNGIDFLQSLKNPPKVIFTTAYTEYAVTSYDLGAVDYLVKPISFERFLKAINKLFPAATTDGAKTRESSGDFMFVRADGKWVKIAPAQIWFIEGLKDYMRIWSADGRLTVHSTMKNMEEQLAAYPQFIRVHKSYLVNRDYITETDGSSITVQGQTIAIGGTYREEVQKLIDTYRLR